LPQRYSDIVAEDAGKAQDGFQRLFRAGRADREEPEARSIVDRQPDFDEPAARRQIAGGRIGIDASKPSLWPVAMLRPSLRLSNDGTAIVASLIVGDGHRRYFFIMWPE
jgi:hypothetical protein